MEIAPERMQAMEEKVDAIWKSVEKTRRYFQITMWVTVIFFVLPLILMVFVVPMFLTSYLGSFDMSSVDPETQNQLSTLVDLLK